MCLSRGSAAIGDGEDENPVGVRAVGDPVLRAVQHPAAARLLGARDHGLRVRAAHRLRQAEAPELFSAGDRREDALLLFVGSELGDGVAKERVVHAHDDAASSRRPRSPPPSPARTTGRPCPRRRAPREWRRRETRAPPSWRRSRRASARSCRAPPPWGRPRARRNRARSLASGAALHSARNP